MSGTARPPGDQAGIPPMGAPGDDPDLAAGTLLSLATQSGFRLHPG